jgi:hypothetical protein
MCDWAAFFCHGQGQKTSQPTKKNTARAGGPSKATHKNTQPGLVGEGSQGKKKNAANHKATTNHKPQTANHVVGS